MRILFLLISLVIIPLYTRAQSVLNNSEEQHCGFDEHHNYLMKTDKEYKERFLLQKAILDSVKYAPVSSNRQLPPAYTIPVVVHVVHLGEQIGYRSNITDQQIYDAITGLNERFANVNGAGNDIEINFCLANQDPNGCPSSGINRVDGSVVPGYRENGITWDGICGVDEKAIKDLSKWPTWQYYNIWVVHDICGSIAGYAYYPNGGEYDGTVIDVPSMKYDNSTLAHEVGHGLNLKHTFSGDDNNTCPVNNNCLEDGDEICDTPPHRTNDCGINNPCSSEGIWNNSRNNWMSYCFPSASAGLFTEDQRTRMRNSLEVDPRKALLSSQACSNEVNMQITSDASILCPFKSRVLTAVPAGGYFAIASGSGYIQGDVLTATGGTNIVVEYIVVQEFCTSSVAQDIPVTPAPHPQLTVAEDSLCKGQSTSLHGFPTGGVYALISGPGVIDSNILTSQDAGMIALFYEKIYAGCVLRDTQEVSSFAIPDVSLEFLSADVLTAVPDTGLFQWLQCDLDYAAVPGATGPVFQPDVFGNYAVVSINGACRDTSACIEVMPTATHDGTTNDDIKLYPNPVKDIFYLSGFSDQNQVRVTIANMSGVQMPTNMHQSKGILEMDISTFVDGVYIVQIEEQGMRRMVYRVVKL